MSKEEIILINRSTIDRHGGNFLPPQNFLHEESLDYLVESVQAEMFGAPLYPTLADKAALYMFNIISNHVFQDGNKRTGLEAAKLFLRLNGSDFSSSLTQIEFASDLFPASPHSRNQHLIEFTLEVASGLVSLEACRAWFAANTEPLPTSRRKD
ncbi:type II toxin-antitoxin system death-on-curing family toxin [Neolewinella xylanilytica]|uniref:type II toxin-antitoxin system death-on-curing family toxin n=1 Tax=Neolewinella xylanilytica TaxID=1514080 RepID=UPI0014737D23|nr:type II toxin-antitoxin system death-on-curing family toxin [Neolewinella xylanilytica]